MRAENDVYELDIGDEVCCAHCMSGTHNYPTYKRGEAYLAGPGHSPYNGEANYVCREHLDKDAVIHDVTPNTEIKAVASGPFRRIC